MTQIDIRSNLIFKYEVYQLIIKPFAEFDNKQYENIKSTAINCKIYSNRKGL